ncbi:MAG: hypothetical protein JWL65_5704 [Gammaproteobacteria bacterium]|nr:hypothetical protein [Gammaproteobacteria bacterium]
MRPDLCVRALWYDRCVHSRSARSREISGPKTRVGERAQRFALRAQGFDVSQSGVAAYSTLGHFNDPILNTMGLSSNRHPLTGLRRACFAAALLGIVLMVLGFRAGAVENADSSRCLRQTPESAVVELLKLTGVFERARAQTRAMVEQLRRVNTKVPEEFWANFASRVADEDALMSLYVPVYLRHLSQDDVCALSRFYRTPLGAHLLHAGPEIQEATHDAAQAWASRIAVDLLGSTGDSRTPNGPQPPPSAPPAQPEDERTTAIHELLRESGDLAAAQQMMSATLDRLRQGPQLISLPPSFWDDARKRLLNDDDLLRLWTPAYVHQFTDAEIRGLIGFYRSAVGVRYVAALPAIEAESLDAGAQLGRDTAKHAVREVFGPLPQWRMLHPESHDATAPNSPPESDPP